MKPLKDAICETKEFLNLNRQRDDGEEFTDDDALDDLFNECGKDRTGGCALAGTEYCDWECPFSY